MRSRLLGRARHAVHGVHGFTILEMLLVVAIAAAAAAAAVQSVEALRQSAIDGAVNEVVQAMRFAQDEAIRSGTPRVVSFEAGNTVRVYQLSYSVTPPVEDPTKPVEHPAEKRTYSVKLSSVPFLWGTVVTTAEFTFANSPATKLPRLAFSAAGEPVTVVGPTATDISQLTAAAGTAQVKISAGNAQRSISVDPVTGRVTLL